MSTAFRVSCFSDTLAHLDVGDAVAQSGGQPGQGLGQHVVVPLGGEGPEPPRGRDEQDAHVTGLK